MGTTPGTDFAWPADARPVDARPSDAQPDARSPVDAQPDTRPSVPADAHPDAAAAPDARPSAPLNLPSGVWSPVYIDGMTCADGTPTGVAFNPGPPGARRILIYMLGGGACWDEDSCYTHPRAAAIAEPILPEALATSDLTHAWFNDRTNADNPFAQDHLVIVPYCTGDLHAGDRVAQYGTHTTHHAGATNFARLAERLAAAYPGVDRVVLSGSSAGGYGATLNWARALDIFPNARVDVVDDSGPPFAAPALSPALLSAWSAAWDLTRTVPADCPTCATDLSAHVAHGLAHARGGRFGLLSSVGDHVIGDYLQIDAAGIAAGLDALSAAAPAGYATYRVPGDSHVQIATPWVAAGLDIPAWIRLQLSEGPDAADWRSVGPEPPPVCASLDGCWPCVTCAANWPCAAQFATCNGIPGCVDAVVCAVGCGPTDQACITACAAAHHALRQEAVDLYTCTRCQNCGVQCGACQ